LIYAFLNLLLSKEKKMTNCIQIQWTSSSIEEARKIGYALVENKLVACVNILPHVESIYSWEGKIESDQEVEVLLKTDESHFEEIKSYIEKHASYDVPAILAFPVLAGNADYLSWINQVTT